MSVIGIIKTLPHRLRAVRYNHNQRTAMSRETDRGQRSYQALVQNRATRVMRYLDIAMKKSAPQTPLNIRLAVMRFMAYTDFPEQAKVQPVDILNYTKASPMYPHLTAKAARRGDSYNLLYFITGQKRTAAQGDDGYSSLPASAQSSATPSPRSSTSSPAPSLQNSLLDLSSIDTTFTVPLLPPEEREGSNLFEAEYHLNNKEVKVYMRMPDETRLQIPLNKKGDVPYGYKTDLHPALDTGCSGDVFPVLDDGKGPDADVKRQFLKAMRESSSPVSMSGFEARTDAMFLYPTYPNGWTPSLINHQLSQIRSFVESGAKGECMVRCMVRCMVGVW